MRVHTEFGFQNEGRDEEARKKGITEGDAIWLHPSIDILNAATVQEELKIPIDMCRALDTPTPAAQPTPMETPHAIIARLPC